MSNEFNNFFLFIRSLPDWTHGVFGDGSDFAWCANRAFEIRTNIPELSRFSVGFLIRQMLEHFTEKIESNLEPDRSIWIYSAHDTTVADFLNSLDLFEVKINNNTNIYFHIRIFQYLYFTFTDTFSAICIECSF